MNVNFNQNSFLETNNILMGNSKDPMGVKFNKDNDFRKKLDEAHKKAEPENNEVNEKNDKVNKKSNDDKSSVSSTKKSQNEINKDKSINEIEEEQVDGKESLSQNMDEIIGLYEAIRSIELNTSESIDKDQVIVQENIMANLEEIKNLLSQNDSFMNNSELYEKIKSILENELNGGSLLELNADEMKKITGDLLKNIREYAQNDEGEELQLSSDNEINKIVELNKDKISLKNNEKSESEGREGKREKNIQFQGEKVEESFSKNGKMDIYNLRNENMNIKDIPVIDQLPKVQSNITTQIDSIKVIEQIVEKASVNLKENGSEMTINLRPEHLGKITMKIEVEREMVVAKIVAENQVVKETLESNFQNLKDSLEEKGFSIGEFSVDISKDDSNESAQQFMNFKNNRGKSKIHMDENIEDTFNEANVDVIHSGTINNLG
ncbi:flagellar hook-length control protein FliK [Anaeromicrobium sediminis]|uniref:Flagellar hook-length control protein-like C-terminal domain-containing protein n=1 Tax=Anaeromicrobium sediminis TaxID=1478221 RepID=A0A267MNV3_9FIRM|nr:flagellar hook-length control protein FliK [Anaeromicrobium sediminis]PAB61269.1 hypothetical protein CCE28_02235 [Anaeromicrobium sediminis]